MAVDFRNLNIWKDAHLLAIEIIKITKNFPKTEQYNLISQMNRAAVSIPSNITEACGQDTMPATKRFLKIAFASLRELEYQLLLSRDLNYVTTADYTPLQSKITILSKMLYRYSSAICF